MRVKGGSLCAVQREGCQILTPNHLWVRVGACGGVCFGCPRGRSHAISRRVFRLSAREISCHLMLNT